MAKLNVCLVSIYPVADYTHSKQSGVASYSKNLVNALHPYCLVTVYADKLIGSKNEVAPDVQRCWNKGLKYPFQILKEVSKSSYDAIHIQYETYLFGGLLSSILFPFLLILLKTTRKPVIVTMHGVIPLSNVNRTFLEENRIEGNPLVLKIGLNFMVKCISHLSTCIVVHEHKLADVLKNEYNCSPSKVKVIHHGIEAKEIIDLHDSSKAKLGIGSNFVILFFGYVTGYKNLELMISSARFIKIPNWKMVIVGGAHPRLGDDQNYMKYLNRLKERAFKTSKNIIFEGFVPDSEIATYFTAADLVVFPYSVCISASGPLSLAAAYERPFIVSSAFKGIISSDEIIFNNDSKELAQKINEFYSDSILKTQTEYCVKSFKAERLWNTVAKKTYELYISLLCEG